MSRSYLARWAALVALFSAACGQRYVSPNTVALVITNDSTGTQRVNRCHFIPVLLGSQVKARYEIEDDLKVTITITRDAVELSYQDPAQDYEPFRISADSLEAGSGVVTLGDPPDGYTVHLTTPCTPDDDD